MSRHRTAALVGNPNAGKSALFNALTGARQKIANYPGVTVERKAGRLTLPSGEPLELIDLPGSYSFDAASPDEDVTRKVVHGEFEGEALPEVLVLVLDAANLEQHLVFAQEVLELGRPTVVALNMVDLAERDGLTLDAAALSAALGGAEATLAYLADLWDVATSESRAQPGASLAGVVASPQAAPLMLCALVAILALARGGLGREALAVGLFVLGVALAAWQNWGNELTGLAALPFLLLALAPRMAETAKVLGGSGRRAVETIAVVLLVWAAPIAVNAQRSLALAYSARPEMAVLAPDVAPDLHWNAPEIGPTVTTPLHPERAARRIAIAGETLPACRMGRSYAQLLSEAAAAVRGDPAMAGRRILALDLTNALWLLGGGAPLAGVYIWVYGDSGDALRQAEVLAVPLCPPVERVRDAMIKETEALGLDLRVIRRIPGWLFVENRSARGE